jgi:hypothetical protein
MVPSDYDNYPQGWARVRAALTDAVQAAGVPADFQLRDYGDRAPVDSPEAQFATALTESWRLSRFTDSFALRAVCDGVLSPREVGE